MLVMVVTLLSTMSDDCLKEIIYCKTKNDTLYSWLFHHFLWTSKILNLQGVPISVVGTAQVRLDVEIMNKKKTVTMNLAHDCDGEDDDDVLQGEDQRIERRDAGVRR